MEMRLKLNNKQGYIQLMRLDKPIGIYLLLWPTMWALILASGGLPDVGVTLIFIAGVVLMRSAGCVINDYADRHVDGAVKRTSSRPLVSGQVEEKEALQLFALLVAISFALVLMLNWQTIAMSVAALALASCYPFMKRYTYLPQAVLGAAFGWAIPMAFTAVMGEVPYWGWMLFVANLLWTIAYDTMYAMVDRDDDVLIGVKSSAILFGKQDKLIIAGLQLVTLALLAIIGVLLSVSWIYYASLGVCVALFAHQHYQIWHRSREGCFQAFLDNHYVGLAFTLGLLAEFVLAR